MKIYHHLLDNNKRIFIIFYFLITIYYFFNCFLLNDYEILFMDERLIVDDIYNVWLLDDTFNRFANIENSILKNLLILITEFSYGGDLRYGRLWSNIFTLIVGPLTFISDHVVISVVRLLNLAILNLSFYLFSKSFIEKKYFWMSMVALYSLPGVEFLILIPKPDVLALLSTAVGLFYFQKDKIFLSIFFLSVATFLKINFFIILIIFLLYFFLRTENKKNFSLKTTFLVYLSLIFVNPILLVPPIKFLDLQLPNFYQKYFEWIFSQGSYGQQQLFSIDFFKNWLKTISNFYLLPTGIDFIIFMIFILFLTSFTNKIYKGEDVILKLFLMIFYFYMFFYMFFIERQFIWYLTVPVLFLTITVFRDIDMKRKLDKIFSFNLILFLILGNLSNIQVHYESKSFQANYKLGYQQIDNKDSAINLVNEIVKQIEIIYSEEDSKDKNIVYWNPNLFIPRNKVTYSSHFEVREYWGSENLEKILNEADFYVTNTDLYLDNVNKIKINNFYIFFY